MKNDDEQSSLMLAVIGIIPVIWFALLVAPYLSSGLMGILDGVPEAMNHPFSIRLCGDSVKTVLIFLLSYGMGIGIYISTKKHYRRGEEHGSAKWGNVKKINRRYKEKRFTKNKLLTMHVQISYNMRKHLRNVLTVVIGGSGSGKTRFFAKPNLMQANTSFVVLDPKGENLRDTGYLLEEKGYEVSASGCGLTEEMIGRLHNAGCTCYGDGWFPEKLIKDIHSVVLGAKVKQDNPELLRAKELGMLIQSIPEFIFQRTRSKTRVVVAGSRGKKTIISMMVCALRRQKLAFDYALTSKVDSLPNRVHLSYEARIALIEGDEHITSALDKRFQLEFYRPHIAILTNLSWSTETDHATPEAYLSTYQSFSVSIEREGKLIYFGGDDTVSQLAGDVRSDITAIPFEEHPVVEKDGQTFLHTRYGDYPVRIPNRYFLINLNAARLACRQLGVKDADFYQALSEYSLSLPI